MEYTLFSVSVVSDIPLFRDFGLDVGVELWVVLDAEPFVNLFRCASCSAWAVLREMMFAAWVQDGRVGAWVWADRQKAVVFEPSSAENPIRLNLNASEEGKRFVLVAKALWCVRGSGWWVCL